MTDVVSSPFPFRGDQRGERGSGRTRSPLPAPFAGCASIDAWRRGERCGLLVSLTSRRGHQLWRSLLGGAGNRTRATEHRTPYLPKVGGLCHRATAGHLVERVMLGYMVRSPQRQKQIHLFSVVMLLYCLVRPKSLAQRLRFLSVPEFQRHKIAYYCHARMKLKSFLHERYIYLDIINIPNKLPLHKETSHTTISPPPCNLAR